MKRVKYFGTNDLSIGWFLNKIGTRLNYVSNKNNKGINDYLEMYNCYQYFKNVPNYKFNKEDEEILNDVMEVVGIYFSYITNDNIVEISKNLESKYKSDFLELIEKFKVYKKVNEDKFSLLLNEKITPIKLVCNFKLIVENFSNVISNHMINNKQSAEIIIDIKIGNIKGNLPKEITNKVANELITQYVKSNNPNYNYLMKIIESAPYEGFNIEPYNKLEAKKKVEEIKNKYFNENKYIEIQYIIEYKDVPQVKLIETNEMQIFIFFDHNYLKSNLDYPTILNNFIWLFDFMDFNGNLTCVLNNKNKQTHLERAFNSNVPKNYPISDNFRQIEIKQYALMLKYYQFLQSNDINIEIIFKWFFEEYLANEFDLIGMLFSISTSCTYNEKCLNIVTNIESILDQFQCYIMYGKIDHQLIHLSSNQKSFQSMNSLISNKYIYCTEKLNRIYKLIFSRYSELIDILECKNSKENNFFELLSNSKEGLVLREENENIKLLKKIKLLKENNDKIITIDNFTVGKVIESLYLLKSISFLRLCNDEKEIINNFYEEKLIYKESSLFSNIEADMFDYYLNNKSFSNGHSLRNAYTHGKVGYLNEKEHYKNYVLLLKIMIMIILKLNEELCLVNK